MLDRSLHSMYPKSADIILPPQKKQRTNTSNLHRTQTCYQHLKNRGYNTYHVSGMAPHTILNRHSPSLYGCMNGCNATRQERGLINRSLVIDDADIVTCCDGFDSWETPAFCRTAQGDYWCDQADLEKQHIQTCSINVYPILQGLFHRLPRANHTYLKTFMLQHIHAILRHFTIPWCILLEILQYCHVNQWASSNISLSLSRSLYVFIYVI